MRVIDMAQGSTVWHPWRKLGLGGSDAPAVMGKSPYMTPLELYKNKTSEAPESEDLAKEFIFSRGHQTEEMIRKEILSLTGKIMTPICVEDELYPFLRASLDGFEPSLGILEAKLVGKEVLKQVAKGIIPPHHYIQCQHSMRVAGVDITRYFAHDMGKQGVIQEIKADKEFQKILLDAEVNFWERVTSKNPPPLTSDDYLEVNEPQFNELLRLKKLADESKAKFEELAEALKGKYSHPKVLCSGVKIITVTRTGNVDYKSIPEVKELASDYLDKFRGKATVYKQIKFPEEK